MRFSTTTAAVAIVLIIIVGLLHTNFGRDLLVKTLDENGRPHTFKQRMGYK